jgi:hypothetical protein
MATVTVMVMELRGTRATLDKGTKEKDAVFQFY